MTGKFGKEWKIGLIVVLAIVLIVFGLKFLLGKSIFSHESQYYTYYDNVQGLQESDAVQINGFSVGRVAAIELQPDRKIKVTFTIQKQLNIPEGSTAQLASADLISGSKIINLIFSDAKNYYSNGSEIKAQNYVGMLSGISPQIDPTLTTVHQAISHLDTLLMNINNMISKDMGTHLNSSMASLDNTMGQLAEMTKALNAQSNHLAGIIQNTDKITGNLAQNNENINQTLNHLNKFSGQLSSGNLDQTLNSLQQTSKNLEGITNQLNNNTGSLGMLLSDKNLYNNLSNSLSSLDQVLQDLKQHPAKYINISVLGRKSN